MSHSNFADIIMDVPGRGNTLVLICVSCIFIIHIDGKIFRSYSTDPCVTSPYEFNERSTFGRFDRYKMQFFNCNQFKCCKMGPFKIAHLGYLSTHLIKYLIRKEWKFTFRCTRSAK